MRHDSNPLRPRTIQMVKDLALKPRSEPVLLATGEESWVYLNLKGVLTQRWQLNLAVDAMINHITPYKATAIGGPTMGADMFAHVMVSRDHHNEDLSWFVVRSARKTTHGLGLWIEGHTLGPADRVIITDDVANSGKSLIEAHERVAETGARILAICPLVDRSGVTEDALLAAGITTPYDPLMSYLDLGIDPLIG